MPIKPNESAFSHELIEFLHILNRTKTCEEAYQSLIKLASGTGFPVVIYEYCHDHTRPVKALFMRSNLPAPLMSLEKKFSGKEKFMPGRIHARDHLTPGVAGFEFADMFADFPSYQLKHRLIAMGTGLRSGFGIPLRTQHPNTRAGIGFVSKLKRKECLEAIERHGMMLCVAAWNTHIRIIQLQNTNVNQEFFTEKQKQFLRLLCDGHMDKYISDQMGISYSGVRKHQNAVAKKLGVKQRSQIVSEVLRRGFLEGEGIMPNLEEGDIWDLKIEE